MRIVKPSVGIGQDKAVFTKDKESLSLLHKWLSHQYAHLPSAAIDMTISPPQLKQYHSTSLTHQPQTKKITPTLTINLKRLG